MKLSALKTQANPDNTRAIPGAVFNFLLNGKQTGGEFSLMEIVVRKGSEPPAHTHQHESETYYVLDGEVNYLVDGKQFTAGKGETMFLPKGLQHAFRLVSDTAHLLMVLSPAGLEQWFWDNSEAYEGTDVPPAPTGPPPAEVMDHFARSLGEFGVMMAYAPVME